MQDILEKMALCKYIDTHAHVYDVAFGGDEEAVIERALAAGVGLILQADIDSSERVRMIDLAAKYPLVLRNMAGLYPGSVNENWEQEVAAVEKYAVEGNVVAIGEIGLDYHYSKDTAELQKRAFKAQLQLADKLGLPVNIHERDATDDFFAVMDECKGLSIRGNLHAFSGSKETFARLQKYGDWMVGIGGVCTFKKAGIAETLKYIPLDRIVLETDAPYLTPVPFRGQRNESSYIPLIAAKIAEIKGIDVEAVAEATTNNARAMFNLDVK